MAEDAQLVLSQHVYLVNQVEPLLVFSFELLLLFGFRRKVHGLHGVSLVWLEGKAVVAVLAAQILVTILHAHVLVSHCLVVGLLLLISHLVN